MSASTPAAARRAAASASLSVTGCHTGRPCCSARRLTALGSSCKPRPAGRSGWVRTRRISWPPSASACSACAAKGGVPAKARRRDASLGGLAQLLRQPRADALLLELGEMLDEHLAFQVVELMLDADRKQPLRLQRERR